MLKSNVTETLFFRISPAISKTILAIWLKDPSLSPNLIADAISDIINVFRNKTEDFFAQKQGAYEFAQIGDKVVQSLLPIFEAESSYLTEDNIFVATLAISNTLNSAGINAQLLAENDLSPALLYNHFITSDPKAITELNELETRLYLRALSECSQAIVDIASQLPIYSERTLGELLKRTTSLSEVANEILATVKNIRDSSRYENKNDEAREYFEAAYRRQVERKLSRVQILGIDASPSSSKYGLSVAYLSLTVNQYGRFRNSNSPVSYVSVERALSQTYRLFVLGAPGSGKTTLLQWIAVNATSGTFSPTLRAWNNKVPFFIRLRDYATSSLPSLSDFVRTFAPSIQSDMPDNWTTSLLRSGRALILIDGLDELPSLQREGAKEWIEDLVANYPDSHYVITSRPYGATPYWLTQQDFTRVDLQPMTPTMIDAFIVRWHNAVRAELIDEDEKHDMEALENSLKLSLRKNRSIRNLAPNPLLCAMICALHRDRYQQLPTRRVALYEAACDMLLEERDRRRRILTDHELDLDFDQKKILLQRLAYWMMNNGYPQIHREEAEHHFHLNLRGLQGIGSKVEAHAVYTLLVQRSGIVREPEIGVLDFIHRTFLEYLAAVAAIDARDIGALVKRATDEQWHEVICLAAGIADAKGRQLLISKLIDNGDQGNLDKTAAYLLAAACLDTVVQIEPSLRNRVEERLASLIPPKTTWAATALSRAGDLAIPFLALKDSYSQEDAVLCIYALAETRNEAALETLATYSKDSRHAVLAQLTQAWRAFEQSEYAHKVLAHCSELIFTRESPIGGCKHLHNVTRLSILNDYNLTDLWPISHLSQLTMLNLTGCNAIENLEPLASLTNLKELILIQCERVENIESLSSLNNLSVLDIRQCDWLNDFGPLANLANLQEVRLSKGHSEDAVAFLRFLKPQIRIKEYPR